MTIAPFSKVAPAVVGSFVAAYVAYYAVAEAKLFGGRPASDIKTLTPAWKEAEKARFMNAPREGAPDKPTIINPFRHNVPGNVRNLGDLPSLQP
eukprot:jgi/Botrbrau1/851/Bobra.0352s0044.1